MTVLDKFISFAKTLPADRRGPVEDAMQAMMNSFADEYAFTASETAELDRRLAEPKAEYAAPGDIEKLLGKPFTS